MHMNPKVAHSIVSAHKHKTLMQTYHHISRGFQRFVHRKTYEQGASTDRHIISSSCAATEFISPQFSQKLRCCNGFILSFVLCLEHGLNVLLTPQQYILPTIIALLHVQSFHWYFAQKFSVLSPPLFITGPA